PFKLKPNIRTIASIFFILCLIIRNSKEPANNKLSISS
ncbi:MAG: hypothetical protein ACI8VT_003989, partial [Saprospiraceae bacterium]